VFVVLLDTLTRGEQTLAGAGESAAVLDLRHRWQMVLNVRDALQPDPAGPA
jgi:hypothetical protein